MNMAHATIVLSKAILEKLNDCSCGQGQKAIYYCHDKKCPQHTTQFLFCEFCNTDENHNHRPQRIDLICDLELNFWKFLCSEAEKKKNSSYNVLKDIFELLDFFEEVG